MRWMVLAVAMLAGCGEEDAADVVVDETDTAFDTDTTTDDCEGVMPEYGVDFDNHTYEITEAGLYTITATNGHHGLDDVEQAGTICEIAVDNGGSLVAVYQPGANPDGDIVAGPPWNYTTIGFFLQISAPPMAGDYRVAVRMPEGWYYGTITLVEPE